MAKEYLKRLLDDELKLYLEAFGSVLIVGPKWCGKTTTAKQFAKSVLELQNPKEIQNILKLADIDVSKLLVGETPRLLDEWQIVPTIWDAVRVEVDNRDMVGQFILTGSAVPQDTDMMHSGTGRIARLKMYPMSLYESNESNGRIGLHDLFKGKHEINGIQSDLTIDDLVYAICRGGWPASLNKSKAASVLISSEYVDALCHSDISRMGVEYKNPLRIRNILRSYARNISTLATRKTILDDVKANDMELSNTTFYHCLNALERLYVIEDIPAWCPSIRSKTSIRSTNKRGFIDPSLAVAALDVGVDQLLNDLRTLGFLFESLCIRDLRIYSKHLGGYVSYYHDRYGLEADAVLHLRDGSFALIEMKLGSREIDEGAKHLCDLKNLLKEHHMQEPSFLMVLTGGNMAYKREDGVLVVPIGCLKD